MKKILLLALLAATTEMGHAQSISAGTISLGGGLGYNSSTGKTSYTAGNTTYSEESKSSEFRFSPTVGFFVVDNLAIGLELGYTSSRRSYTTRTPSPAIIRAELDPTTTLRVGPYVQYYKMLTEQFGLLATLGGGYQSTREFDYDRSVITERRAAGSYAALTPGIIFFPIPKIGLSASIGSLGYNRLKYDYPTNSGNAPSGYEEVTSDFGLGFGLSQLQFGGTFYLGR